MRPLIQVFTLCSLLLVGIAADAAQRTLVVLNKVGNDCWLIDPETGEARAKLKVGEGPHEAACSPDGRIAVVCNYGGRTDGSTLSVIDVRRAEVLRSIDLSPHGRPHGIRYLDAEHVLVTSETSRKLLKVHVESGRMVAVYDAGGDIHMVDTTADSRQAYATAIRGGLLTRVDLGDPQASPETLSLGSGTEALALRPGGREVWVGNNNDHTVRVVDAKSFEQVAELPCGVQPIRIAFTRDGRHAMVACLLSGDLAVIDADTRKLVQRVPLGDFVAPMDMWEGKTREEQQALVQRVVADGARPIGVLAAPDGNVYVAARGQSHIVVLDPRTWKVTRRLPAGDGPDGMAWSRID